MSAERLERGPELQRASGESGAGSHNRHVTGCHKLQGDN